MSHEYSSLFKNMTAEQWQKIVDECKHHSKIREYFGINLPNSVIAYYERKFNYFCPIPAACKDERGNRYGHLTVVDYIPNSSNIRGALWKCQCDCGTIVNRSGVNLRQGQKHIQMCDNCIKNLTSERFFKDLTGQQINLLLVQKRIGSNDSGNALYECKCLNCNRVFNVDSSRLRGQFAYYSCGCINSRGEQQLATLLSELKINYQAQYSFKDCKNKYPLRFDFAIFSNDQQLLALIEFQGIQHYTYNVNGSWVDTKELFEERLKRDNIKKEYCNEQKIPLIIIPYTDLSKLNELYLMDLFKQFSIKIS